MSNNSQSKYILVGVLILILFGLFYFFVLRSPNVPYQTLAPDNYEPGTTVSLYNNAPPSFPKEVILENKFLNYSGVVALPGGKTQTKVSYQSDKSVADALALYKTGLPTGWTASVAFSSATSAIINAKKGTDSVLITIAAAEQDGTNTNAGSLVTFQYDK